MAETKKLEFNSLTEKQSRWDEGHQYVREEEMADTLSFVPLVDLTDKVIASRTIKKRKHSSSLLNKRWLELTTAVLGTITLVLASCEVGSSQSPQDLDSSNPTDVSVSELSNQNIAARSAANTRLVQAVAANQKIAQDLYEQGIEKTQAGDYQGAIADFNRVIALNPNYIEAYCHRAMAHWDLGNYQKAMADFNLAIQVSPLHADAYNKRGVALAQQGNLNQALADFNQALLVDSNFVDAYYNRGKARTELGKYQGAIADYDRAIRLDPTLAEAYGNRGFLRAQLGNKQEGLEDLQHAAKLFLDAGNVFGYQQTIVYIQMIQQQSE